MAIAKLMGLVGGIGRLGGLGIFLQAKNTGLPNFILLGQVIAGFSDIHNHANAHRHSKSQHRTRQVVKLLYLSIYK